MISIKEAKGIYEHLKAGVTQYDEETHCVMVIRVMSDSTRGTITAFCKEAKITDRTFYNWKLKHAIFDECYRYGCAIARENWEDEGRCGKDDEHFNLEYWRIVGASRFGVGKTNRVRLEVSDDANPYDQYKQLIGQANNGDFTAGELKQIMESINVGSRTFEVFELQKEVDRLREDLLKMEKNRVNNSISIEKTAEIN